MTSFREAREAYRRPPLRYTLLFIFAVSLALWYGIFRLAFWLLS